MAVLKKKTGKQPQKVKKDSKARGSSDGAAQSQLRQGRVTAQNLNLRSESSTKSPKLDVLKKGTVVNILGSEGAWLKIEHGLVEGFAHSRFIEPIETPPSETRDYQQQFLDLLNNKPDPSTSEKPREKGFIALVSGTTDLTEFEALCFSSRQSRPCLSP